ncbi:TPA: hypothetical protein H3G30_002571 [Escherichia coli]|uniref:hypothetical protein n=1 Tax=Escherichia coli TaxID=562 RepID=UPI0009C0819B|nr:hypothetical protein [Escherichia coli]ARD51678.1 hypothetical protein BHT24_10315 [Escherichia coli]EGE3554275.1 hypothetical protein [Escherichia coli]KAA1990843.1 hypothetical protein EA213_16360 [Escherichia coli]HAK9281750.1 hypothetical protein [Escherichia coli]HAM5522140.1 hypothetical protein [Escherichia coli]
MEIMELVKPGSWIDSDDSQWSRNVERIISQLESCFNEAFVSLLFFDREIANVQGAFESRREWLEDREERIQIQKSIEHEFDLSVFENHDKLSKKVESILNQKKLNEGKLPSYLQHSLPFIYAKSFLYSLDTIEKIINILPEEPEVQSRISKIKMMMGEAFPDLIHVRDSSHHIEDRVLGKKRGKLIELQPIDDGGIKSEGGVLVISHLSGSSFGCTMGNGSYGKVDVTRETLEVVRDIIQKVIDSFKWK